MGALNTHEVREREIEALRASISRLSAAKPSIRDSSDLNTVLQEALEPLRQGVDHFAAVGGRVFLLPLDDLLHDDTEAAMAFDGVLPPESASFAGQAGISRPMACQNTPERHLHRSPSQGPQVPPPVANPEWPARSVVAIRLGPTVPTGSRRAREIGFFTRGIMGDSTPSGNT